MKELYELKEKLCNELKNYSKKEMSSVSLEVIDKLAHTIKNLDRIIENYGNDGYSGNYGHMNGSYENRRDMSYARGRDSRGRYMTRDNDYSNDDRMVSELRMMMDDAPDERTKQEFKRFISKIESM